MLAIDLTKGLEDAWSSFAQFVPKFLGALAILLIGWLIAKVIRKAVHRLLTKLKFDSWVDKSGLGEPLSRAGYKDSGRLLASLVYIAVMLIVIQMAINVFGNASVSEAFQGLIEFIPRLFIALIIIVLTGVVANTVKGFIAPAVANNPAGNIFTNVAMVAIWIIGGFAALDQLGVAKTVVDTLFQTITYGLGLVFVISFGVGGINAARDRFWPAVYDAFSTKKSDK